MAKIGNETKLVLKLVRERMGSQREHHKHFIYGKDWYDGYEKCYWEWCRTTDSVVEELEIK